MATYDRYSEFRSNGTVKTVPFIGIPPKNTDFFEVYDKSKTRLDIISYDYYGNANYAWLIMQANPQYGAMEYEIPDGATLRIPYPLDDTLTRYGKSIEEYFRLN